VRRRRGKVGRPYKGRLCLLCASQPRAKVTRPGETDDWCAECRDGYNEAYRRGDADTWLGERKRSFRLARAKRDARVRWGFAFAGLRP
jgi:hypothetical protein